jgi:hypothetical protein
MTEEQQDRSNKLFQIITGQLNLLKEKNHVVELLLENELTRCFGVVECKIKITNDDESYNICLHFLITEDDRYHFSYTIKNKTETAGFTNNIKELQTWAKIYLESMYLSKIRSIDALEYKKKHESLTVYPIKKKKKKSWLKFLLIIAVIFLFIYLWRKFRS